MNNCGEDSERHLKEEVSQDEEEEVEEEREEHDHNCPKRNDILVNLHIL